jgi:hypothetical protein
MASLAFNPLERGNNMQTELLKVTGMTLAAVKGAGFGMDAGKAAGSAKTKGCCGG